MAAVRPQEASVRVTREASTTRSGNRASADGPSCAQCRQLRSAAFLQPSFQHKKPARRAPILQRDDPPDMQRRRSDRSPHRPKSNSTDQCLLAAGSFIHSFRTPPAPETLRISVCPVSRAPFGSGQSDARRKLSEAVRLRRCETWTSAGPSRAASIDAQVSRVVRLSCGGSCGRAYEVSASL